MSEWTLEQATELIFEQMLTLMDGCDDEDSVRPALVFEALREAWSPKTDPGELPTDLDAGEVRKRVRTGIQRLAEKSSAAVLRPPTPEGGADA